MGWSVHCHTQRGEWSIFDSRQKLVVPVYQFLLIRKEEGSPPNTLKAVAYDLMHLYRFLGHKGLDLKSMEAEHIGQFRTWMHTPKEKRGDPALFLNADSKYSPKSWNRLLSSVISYVEWHDMTGRRLNISAKLLSNEKRSLGGKRKKKSRWKSKESTEAIEYISPEMRASIRAHLSKRDQLIFDFIYFSGMRIGEVFSMQKDQFPPNPSADAVIKMDLKESIFESIDRQTKSGERFIYIPSALYKKITQYITFKRGPAKHGFPFTASKNTGKSKKGAPLSPGTFRKNLGLACKKSGLKYTPHDLRHTLATDLYRATNDIRLVQDVLGHKSIDTTEKYTHLLDDEIASTIGGVLESLYGDFIQSEVY